MNQTDIAALMQGIAPVLRDAIERAVQPLVQRLLVLEAREPEKGERGDPGRDGLTLTDFDTDLSEDGRTLTLSLQNEEVKVTHQLQLATMIYRGVFKEGETYVQGDCVTWAGSLFHCNAETTHKPGEGASAWTLAAKRGRDGKDGLAGKDGAPGRPGKDAAPRAYAP